MKETGNEFRGLAFDNTARSENSAGVFVFKGNLASDALQKCW